MTLRSHRSKLTVIGLVVAVCALAGCGRKAGLDLPPGAAALQQEQRSLDEPSSAVAHGNVYEPSSGNNQSPSAPRGEKKRIILDPILD